MAVDNGALMTVRRADVSGNRSDAGVSAVRPIDARWPPRSGRSPLGHALASDLA
jgi:hypothetical protein